MDNKSDVFMANNGKYNKHTRKLIKTIYSFSKGEKCKMHKIDWYEGGLQLSEIDTKNVSEYDLTPRMKYIMVRLDN